MSEIIADTQVT